MPLAVPLAVSRFGSADQVGSESPTVTLSLELLVLLTLAVRLGVVV